MQVTVLLGLKQTQTSCYSVLFISESLCEFLNVGNDYLVGFCWFVRRWSRLLHQSVVVLLLSLGLSPIPSLCSVQWEIWAKFLTK